jgi:hypothetical protein
VGRDVARATPKLKLIAKGMCTKQEETLLLNHVEAERRGGYSKEREVCSPP